MKKSFIIYGEWARMITELPDKDAGQLIKALCAHACGETRDIKNPILAATFSMIAERIDEDGRKYAETIEKRRKAADERWHKQSGGKYPQGNTKADTEMHLHAYASTSSQKHYVNDNDNVNDNVFHNKRARKKKGFSNYQQREYDPAIEADLVEREIAK